MNTYDWAANPQKLARAIGIGGNEATIKATYIAIGGLLTPEYHEATPVIEIPGEPIDATPVKKAKKAKKNAK